MNTRMQSRIGTAAKELIRDISKGFDAGTNLVGIIELPTGTAQFHLTLVTDENEFIDVDEPTGCADDLMVTTEDFD